MSKETINLTKALKGIARCKTVGRRTRTGTCARKIRFRKGREYEVQQTFTTADGNRVFPDVVINLPDGKKD
jgi:DNA recombination protein RmuC